jgi:hypothetical protein
MDIKLCETEVIDKLYLELRQFTKARTWDELNYDKLINAVQRKFKGESRFETALRYIQQAENQISSASSADKGAT